MCRISQYKRGLDLTITCTRTAKWVAAPLSQTPTVFNVLAAVALVAVVVIPIIGSERISRLIGLLASWPSVALRAPCLIGVALGLFLIWSLSPVWTAL